MIKTSGLEDFSLDWVSRWKLFRIIIRYHIHYTHSYTIQKIEGPASKIIFVIKILGEQRNFLEKLILYRE